MADDKNTANTSPFPEGYQPQSRRERREMEEYFARLAAEKAAAEKTATEQNAAAKNAEREEAADEENTADVETTKDFSEMTPKERRKAKRAEQAELTYSQAQEEGRLGEWLWVQAREGGTVILYALVIAFLVKTFLLRGFYIPSGSMEQTLQGILPDTSSNFLVKRVIGTPGDVVESDGNGKIKVNGVEITEPYLYPGNPPSEMPFKVTVPAGKYFVMGDHRSNSADSRYHISDGTAFISKDDVQGNVFVVAWPLNHFGLLQDQSSVFSSVPEPTSTPSE